MKKIIIALSVFLLSYNFAAGHTSEHANGAQNPPDPKAKEFGEKVKSDKVTSLSNVISNFADFAGRPVVFEATAKKVCEKKGCWMVLEDGEYEVRTLFKDYGFFVPANILGKKVQVEGVLEQKKVSAATLRHFMKDEGKKMEDIKKVKTGKVQLQFVATGVKVI